MKTIIWMTQPGMEPYAQGQQAAWLHALEAEGWSVTTQQYQSRAPWRSLSKGDLLIWNFVPTPLDVWSARLYAGKQMAVISELPQKLCSLPKLERWCVPSESMRMHLRDGGITQDKIDMVQGYAPQGTGTSFDVRTQLRIDVEKPLLYSSGPLVASTGNKLAIWSLSILQKLHPGACLVLHGEGPEQERLRRFAESVCEPGTVYFAAGAVSPHELVAQADVACLPLREDGVPDALFAALSLGKPILTAQQPSLMEWLRHDVNALVLPSDRAPVWAASLDRVLRDSGLLQKLSLGARGTAIPTERVMLPVGLRRNSGTLAAA